MSHMFQSIVLIIALFIHYVNGIEYHVSVGDDCTNYPLTATDTCIIHCDKKRKKNLSFNCGTSGQCIFNCEQNKCFEKGILNAANSLDLNILSTGNECLKTATINLPNYGNGLFSMNAAKSFKEMTVNSGTNTNNIIIDCTFGNGDECKHITINAQTAQFLQITIGSNSEITGTSTRNAIINCPQNSLYSDSSCVLDVLDNGIISYLTINTLYGVPKDLRANIGTNALVSAHITCINGISNIDGNIIDYGECWSRDISTYFPTILPTNSPTINPTKSPINPTQSLVMPTESPVMPTESPTLFPTNNPTVIPTKTRTPAPIFAMDTTMSVSTTKDIINSRMIETTLVSIGVMDTTEMRMERFKYNTSEGIGISNGHLWMFTGVFIVCLCGCCVGVYCIRKRCKKKNHINKTVIQYELKSNSSNHVVTITMSPKSVNSNTHTRVPSNYSDIVMGGFDVDMNACVSLEDNMALHETVDGENNETNETDVYYSSSGTEM